MSLPPVGGSVVVVLLVIMQQHFEVIVVVTPPLRGHSAYLRQIELSSFQKHWYNLWVFEYSWKVWVQDSSVVFE
jgi:hypothetical protein